jgi:DNA-binding LytR/AlgR family response regulator
METINVVIVDDERIMAEELKTMLEELCPDVEIAGVCHDGEEALRMIAKLKPELVFLDIEMPGMTGLEVAEKLTKIDEPPVIVFVTAFDEFALKAFAVNALDYILKPLDEQDIQRVMKKVGKYIEPVKEDRSEAQSPVKSGYMRKFSVEKGDRMEIVDSDDIQMIYAKDRQVFILTLKGERYRAKLTLHDFENRLPPEKFFRCHRNYIVNINEIKQITTWFKKGYLLILKGAQNVEVPVGRAYVSKMKEYILM